MRASSWVTAIGLFGMVGGTVYGCGDDCDCPGGGGIIDAGPDTGGGTGGTRPDATAGRSRLGERCETNADCGGDLQCLEALGDSQLPGGLCTVPCDQDDAVCDALKDGAFCADLGFAGEDFYCVDSCEVGAEIACGNRADVMCVQGIDPFGVLDGCLPLCTNDAQCPPGTVCNGESNLCTEDPDPGTLPLGAVCDATAATDECEQGVCLPLSSAEPTNGVCTMACRPATLPQCGWSGPPDDVSGICLSTADEGPADLGICGATCNCNEECAHPDFVCIAQPSLEDFGARGICLLQSEDEPEPGIETCPTGGGAGAGGAAGMGGMGGGAGAPGGAAGAAGGGMGGAAGQGAGGTAGGG